MTTNAWGELCHAVSEYGKAMEEFGRKGGRVPPNAEPPFLMVPADEESHRKACECYGRVLDLLKAQREKSRLRKIWEVLFGD